MAHAYTPGLTVSEFATRTGVAATTLRLSSLMDGLAIQLALAEPGMTPARFRRLWLEAAALELGVSAETFKAPRSRPARRRAAS